MRFNPLKDVSYHHHWKLMTFGTAALLLAVVFALIKSWFLVAVVLGVFFLMLLVQWLTIDPPDVTDEDVHGPGGSHGRS